MFTASKHFPAATSHRTVIQGIAFQLDECLKRYKICTQQFSLFSGHDHLKIRSDDDDLVWLVHAFGPFLILFICFISKVG